MHGDMSVADRGRAGAFLLGHPGTGAGAGSIMSGGLTASTTPGCFGHSNASASLQGDGDAFFDCADGTASVVDADARFRRSVSDSHYYAGASAAGASAAHAASRGGGVPVRAATHASEHLQASWMSVRRRIRAKASSAIRIKVHVMSARVQLFRASPDVAEAGAHSELWPVAGSGACVSGSCVVCTTPCVGPNV